MAIWFAARRGLACAGYWLDLPSSTEQRGDAPRRRPCSPGSPPTASSAGWNATVVGARRSPPPSTLPRRRRPLARRTGQPSASTVHTTRDWRARRCRRRRARHADGVGRRPGSTLDRPTTSWSSSRRPPRVGARLGPLLDVVEERIIEPYPVFSQLARRPGAVRAPLEDDPDFDLARHVTRVTLSGGTRGRGGRRAAGLRRGTPAACPSTARTRPLWEVHLVDGRGAGAALVFRIRRRARRRHRPDSGAARPHGGRRRTARRPRRPLGDDPTSRPCRSLPSGGAGGRRRVRLRLARATTRSGWDRLRSKGARAAVTDARRAHPPYRDRSSPTCS